MSLKSIILLVLVNAAALAVGYGIFEFQVRNELLSVYKNNATPMMVINRPLTYVEAIDGYFGRPKEVGPGRLNVNEVRTTAFISLGENRFQSIVRTNNLGFLSDKQYAFDRPADRSEYRIYFAGDSMTGTTTMDFQWVDLVEDILNSDVKLAEIVGVDRFRTYNGGIPGGGFEFYWNHYNTVGRRLDPDMVIVNYIESNFGLVGKTGHEVRTDDEDHAVTHATGFLNKLIAELGDRVHITVMPLFQNLYPDLSDFSRSKALSRAVGRPFTFMHERLPWKVGASAVRTWYNLPLDGHMSEIGGTYYAEAMAELIAERLTGRTFDLSRPDAVPLAPELPKAQAFFSEENQARNLFEPLRSSMFAHGPMTVAGSAIVSPRWMVISDGTGGKGVLRVHASPADDAHPAGVSGPILSVVQESVSTAGAPSVMVDAPGWNRLETDTVLVGFRARLPEGVSDGRPIAVLYAHFGNGGGVPAPQIRYHERLRLRPEWTDHIARVELPTAAAEIPADRPGVILRLQLLAAATGEPFNVDLADPILVRDRPSSQRRDRVIVGTRELPVSAFLKLRKKLDEVFLEPRRKSWRLYGLNRLLGREIPYGFLPVGVPYTSGFVPLDLETDPPEKVLLNLYCTQGEIRLDNLDCYHSYIMFAR